MQRSEAAPRTVVAAAGASCRPTAGAAADDSA